MAGPSILTAAQLARTVRIMNTYYSNLIEGHNTRPREIEQALQGIEPEDDRRDLKIEAVAHYRVQQEIDEREAAGMLPDPASIEFIRYLHRAFYDGATVKMLTIVGNHHSFVMTPGRMAARGGAGRRGRQTFASRERSRARFHGLLPSAVRLPAGSRRSDDGSWEQP